LRSELTRAAFLSRGARTATVVAVGSGGLGVLTDTARADTLPDNDLAYLRIIIASELLAIDFYTNAVATKQFAGQDLANLRQALADEKAHYAALAQALTDAGQVPATADDIDFAYPKGAFGSRASTARLGVRLEAIFVGSALGAAAGLQTDALRLQLAQIAASESRHLAAVSVLSGRSPIGVAFPPALSLDQATAALDPFES
jgi:demethoxyubiquinone hydroxylase (CLK1/Coq7/Cat5 family)